MSVKNPMVSDACAEYCPNLQIAQQVAEATGVDVASALSAVCHRLGASACEGPSYNFDEAGLGHDCRAPQRAITSEAIETIARDPLPYLADVNYIPTHNYLSGTDGVGRQIYPDTTGSYFVTGCIGIEPPLLRFGKELVIQNVIDDETNYSEQQDNSDISGVVKGARPDQELDQLDAERHAGIIDTGYKGDLPPSDIHGEGMFIVGTPEALRDVGFNPNLRTGAYINKPGNFFTTIKPVEANNDIHDVVLPDNVHELPTNITPTTTDGE